ncbi:leucine zipper putative tumor suppressor 1 [Trichechus manatus latirostris]|uniref:Leucine zipper putative tumor suppressor 1 n=1 Tax=Trichechus manatus latirostris TaxID=127582 RepID=A0A2Y9FYR5_TRIMA|nr:leucine zipper putative tumor suppressor 1 [Trichechus manatus latirostris]
MGSVSSLISGHGFHSKHCRASQYKLRKSSHLKKLNRYSDGLLRFGFSQESGHGKSSSKMGKSEDFFYIKVSQKARGSHRPDYTALSSGDMGQAGVGFGSSTPPKLMPFSNQLEMGSEKGAVRPTAFKPMLPRSGALLHSSPESASHQLHPAPPDKPKEQELKPSLCSGALSDSGRNSMSSLPTHSTSSSYQLDPLVTPVGPTSRFGGSAHNITQGIILQDSNMMSLKALSFSDGGSKLAHPGKAEKGPSCVRAPISTDECTIQELEQKLLEREGELQKLQHSFEKKELASSQVYEERQRRCKEELEGLEQKCNSKLKQASQKSQRTQQVLHLQVLQLQQEKRQLRQELESLMKEQDLLETKLRSYEKEKTNFAPALEETQWEGRGAAFPRPSHTRWPRPGPQSKVANALFGLHQPKTQGGSCGPRGHRACLLGALAEPLGPALSRASTCASSIDHLGESCPRPSQYQPAEFTIDQYSLVPVAQIQDPEGPDSGGRIQKDKWRITNTRQPWGT